MVPEAVHKLIRHASDESVEAALEDGTAFFWVEWREDDDQIPGLWEAGLKTGKLSADWNHDDSLAVVWRGKRFPVPLAKSIADSWLFFSVQWILPSLISDRFLWPSRGNRHITLLTLNHALHPDYEIRFVKESIDGEQAAFAPLAAADWLALEQQYGPEAVSAVFAPIQEHPNLFTEKMSLDGPEVEPWELAQGLSESLRGLLVFLRDLCG